MPRKKQRRSYGIGRKFRRGRLWWVAIYDGDGKEIRRPTHSTNEADADALLGQLLRERSRGELIAINAPEVFTVADVLDDYLKRRRETLAPGTMATYESEAESLLKPYFGLLPPAKLTTDLLSDYRDYRSSQNARHHNGGPGGSATKLAKKVSQTSINRELGLLRSALRDLAKRRPAVLPSLPYFPMEKEQNARQGFLSETMFCEKLFPELPRHLQALAACAFYGGGRRSEWLRVDWPEVDFERMVIRFVITKNKNPREVPIVRGLMLTSLLDALKLRDAAWPDQSAVFCYDGHRLSTVGDAWDKACTRAGCEGLLFHDLRRSANKNMRDRHVGQNVRMAIMGHRTASMDIRYGIVDEEDIADAREKLGRERPKKLTRVK